jgi:hypothetical protein
VTLNRELFQQTLEAVRADSARFDMADWWSQSGEDGVQLSLSDFRFEFESGDCGSTACIGGTTISIADVPTAVDVAGQAADLLGLLSTDLFFSHAWPAHYRDLAEDDSEWTAAVSLMQDMLDGTVKTISDDYDTWEEFTS